MKLVTPWNPRLFEDTRQRLGISMAELIRLLNRVGLSEANTTSIRRWSAEGARGPRAVYRHLVERAVADAERLALRERGAPTPIAAAGGEDA